MERRHTFASRARLIGIALLVLTAAAGCGSDGLRADRPVATVDGHEITNSEVTDLVDAQIAYTEASLKAAKKSGQTAEVLKEGEKTLAAFRGTGTDTISATGAAQAITTLIDIEVLGRALKKAGGKITDEKRTTLRSELKKQLTSQKITATKAMEPLIKAEVERQALGQALTEKVAPSAEYEAKLQAAYKAQLAELSQLCVKLVVTADQTSAQAAFDRIKGGEDIGAVAADVSIDATSAAAAGDAGCVARGGVANVFGAAAVNAAKVGDLLGPADGDGSFLIVQITGTNVPTFEESRAQLAEQIPDSSSADVSKILAKAYAATDVTIDARYGTWDAKKGTVVPPVDPLATTTTTVPATVPATTVPATAPPTSGGS